MTDNPSDEKEADRRFNETLGRLVNSPPKPHKAPNTIPKPGEVTRTKG